MPAQRRRGRSLVASLRRRSLACLLVLLAASACARATPAPPELTRAELAAARARLASARAELAAHPEAARVAGIVVEPFGSQRHSNVQAFFNAQRAPLWGCLAGASDADVVIAYDARGLTDLAAFGADLARRADVERCLRRLVAAGPLARPAAPGRVLLVPAALAPTMAPGSR